MTYDYASYFSLLLLCGYEEELQNYIDAVLEEREQLSDVILELSTSDSDPKTRLGILNEYMRRTNKPELDREKAGFELIMDFLRKKRREESMSDAEMTELMYNLAMKNERWTDEPWYSLYLCGMLYEEVREGWIDAEGYFKGFEELLNNNSPFTG